MVQCFIWFSSDCTTERRSALWWWWRQEEIRDSPFVWFSILLFSSFLSLALIHSHLKFNLKQNEAKKSVIKIQSRQKVVKRVSHRWFIKLARERNEISYFDVDSLATGERYQLLGSSMCLSVYRVHSVWIRASVIKVSNGLWCWQAGQVKSIS